VSEDDEMKKIIFAILVLILTACAPASVPSATPISTHTATNTEAPTITPSPTVTPSPTTVPNGPCDNPLVPLAIGNNWTYRAKTEKGEKLYNLRALERQDAGNVVMLVEFGDFHQSIQEPVVCLNGVIEDLPLFVMDMLFSDYLDKPFNTYHDTGIYAPAYQTFVDNNWILNWEAKYLTEDAANIKNPMGGSDLVVLQSSPMDLSFQTDGSREPVTVPAGDFPAALKVSHTFNLTVTITLPTGGAGGLLTLNTTQWYEPYVGLVRAQLDSASLRMGTQEFSIPMKSTVELEGWMPGN
jgi:hypothetical protein